MDKNLSDISSSLTDVADVLELAVKDPKTAADLLDKWANEVHELADQLRNGNLPEDTVSTGGMGEKVMIRTFGPDGSPRAQGGTN